MDLGSDGLCAFHWLEFAPARLNIDKYADPSHGCNRCMILPLQVSELFSLFLVLLASWNLPFGPGPDEQMRNEQLRQGLAAFLAQPDAAASPLSVRYTPKLARAFRRNGHVFDSTRMLEPQVLQKLSERVPFVKTGQLIALSRFLGIVSGVELNTPCWEVDEFERLLCSMELDFLKGGAFMDRLRLRPGPAQVVGEDGGPVAERRLCLEDRTLKAACHNAVAVSVCILSDKASRRICAGVNALAAPLKQRHSYQNRLNRSSEGCLECLLEQTSGGYLEHVSQILAGLSSCNAISEMGFDLSILQERNTIATEDYGLEDELAELIGRFGMHLVKNMLRRGLWYLTWPAGLFSILRLELASPCLQFKKDVALHRQLMDMLGKSPMLQTILQRHLFEKTSCKQLILACEEFQYSAHPDLLALVGRRGKGIMATQAVEDVVSAQKNNRKMMSGKRFRKVEWSMAAALRSRILDNRHKFSAQQVERSVTSKSSRVPSAAFRALPGERSLPFGDIEGFSSAPSWFSPSVTNVTANCAEIFVLRQLAAADNLSGLSSLWLGSLINVNHNIAFKRAGDTTNKWHFGLVSLDHLRALYWPCKRKSAPTKPSDAYFEFAEKLDHAPVLAFCDLFSWVACSVTWKAPVPQVAAYGPSKPEFCMSLRPFATGPEEPIIKVAARQAFWRPGRRSCRSRGTWGSRWWGRTASSRRCS